MTCIKTGARVLLTDYNCVVAADLYRVAGAIVIRANENALKNANFAADAVHTHTVTFSTFDGLYSNMDTGHIVVPEDCVGGLS